MEQPLGIDVSVHNGTLDWNALKAAGVQFAIIRAGYGRYQVDAQFANNITGAKAAGIPVGVYWFSYAISEDTARQEAAKCVGTLSGYAIDLPVFYDFEYDSIRYAQEQGVTIGKAQYNAFAVAFLEEIRQRGYTPGIYYNLDFYRTLADPAKLAGYAIWYAQYASAPTLEDWRIWQYTSSGSLPGVSGSIDLNRMKDSSLLPAPEVQAGWRKNDTGWWYVRSDGSYPKAQWELIDGKWYYFNDAGYMLENQWLYYADAWYYLGPDGAMLQNVPVILDESGRLMPNLNDQ